MRTTVFETVLNQLKETGGLSFENKKCSDVLTFSNIRFLSCTLKRERKVMTSRKSGLLFRISLKMKKTPGVEEN